MTEMPFIEEIPYIRDSAARFSRLAQLPWCVFLDSGQVTASGARYDVLSAEPKVRLTSKGYSTQIIAEDGRVLHSADDPFDLVRRYLGPPRPAPKDLPFAGGAIGYFGYDLARRIERLPDTGKEEIGMPDMAIGIYDWAAIVDHRDQRTWIVDYRDRDRIQRWKELVEPTDVVTPAVYSSHFSVTSAVKPDITPDAYATAFERIKRYIRDGDCYQVNLTQRFSATAEGQPWDAYRHLRDLNPAPFSAYFAIEEGAVLSSSPERFLQLIDDKVETRPIKGTRSRGKSREQDQQLMDELKNSVKDKAENVMIVDLLRNDLGKSCAVGSVRVPNLFELQSFATVHHLVSTVCGRLAEGKDALALLRGCFPGGSITGAPKLRAMEIIEELETCRRSVYCGSIGYIGFDGRMDTNIAIRTLVFSDCHLYCWAGGGIVYDSDLDAEYQESWDKAAAMIQLFLSTEVPNVGHQMWR
jgi:para-aminobenzoate synthetase component 1